MIRRSSHDSPLIDPEVARLPRIDPLVGLSVDPGYGSDSDIDAVTYVSTYYLPKPTGDGPLAREYSQHNRKNRAPLCEYPPWETANGMAIDPAGNLWITTSSYGIFKWAPNCGQQLGSLGGDIFNIPADITFDKLGHTYVSNVYTSSTSGGLYPGNVLQYTHGQITATLNDVNFYQVIGVAVDAHNNVWVSYNGPDYNTGTVAEFAHGGAPPRDYSNVRLNFAGGVELDKAGNLLVVDQKVAKLDVYAPPYTGAPVASPALHGATVFCSLNRRQTHMYCADYQYEEVDVYTYPTMTYEYSYNNALFDPPGVNVIGIANAPRARN